MDQAPRVPRFHPCPVPDGAGFGFHPHSGIATLTCALDAHVAYEDTAGQQGVVQATGLEWVQAGGGTWHQGHIHPQGGMVTSFQLWLALPPEWENAAADAIYMAPEQVPQVDNVRVLLGRYGEATNPIPPSSPPLYLVVVLQKGDHRRYQPPAGHRVAWALVYRGQALVEGNPVSGELVVLEPGEGAVPMEAIEPCRLLFGGAVAHEHPLALGSHSVHTSREALANGLEGIEAVGHDLRAAGRL